MMQFVHARARARLRAPMLALVSLGALLMLSVSAALGPAAWAFKVTPFSFDLEPKGPGATRVLRVENTHDQPISVDIEAVQRFIDETGVETYQRAEDDFTVFPPQAMIEPGKTQAFRVRYIGDPALRASRSYVIYVNQLPLSLSGARKSGVEVVFRFGAAAHVTPRGSAPRTQILHVTRGPKPEQVTFTAQNAGTRYERFGDRALIVRSGDQTFSLAGDEARASIPSPLLAPGAKRTITLTLPPSFPRAGPVSVSLAQGR